MFMPHTLLSDALSVTQCVGYVGVEGATAGPDFEHIRFFRKVPGDLKILACEQHGRVQQLVAATLAT